MDEDIVSANSTFSPPFALRLETLRATRGARPLAWWCLWALKLIKSVALVSSAAFNVAGAKSCRHTAGTIQPEPNVASHKSALYSWRNEPNVAKCLRRCMLTKENSIYRP